MPAFNGYGPLVTTIGLSDTIPLFAATDSLTAPVNSKVVCITQSGPTARGIREFTMNFASSPTAVVEIFGSFWSRRKCGMRGAEWDEKWG